MLRARFDELGVSEVEVVAPTEHRRVVLAAATDAWAEAATAAALRDDGWLAVVRPDAGPRLDAWIASTRPIVFGDSVAVAFAWSEHDRRGLPPTVELGLGGFGNGSHPTTAMLVDVLAGRLHGGERLLDVGCGSGVLALCALVLGAGSAVAVDIKPEAVEATRRNADLNGVAERIDARLPPLEDLDGTFEVIVANVGRSAIVELAPQLVRLLAPGGWLAVSGISPPQGTQVVGFLEPLAELARTTSSEWSVVVLGQPGSTGWCG
ncbi:MAG: ribosomal protein methyltransferase [Ilumatobacteraceae bacterium]|nr:ribosomal protein methyltransferase [Ilumatobacteraceae bacterium]